MERDERILLAAKELFYERGFEAVGVDDIGAKAGITGPAIYRHFSSKQELLGALFDRALDTLLEKVGPAASSNPWEELDHLVRAHLDLVIEDPQLAAVYQREDRSLDDARRRQFHRRRGGFVKRWVDTLERALPERSQSELTSATWGAIDMMVSIGSWPPDARQTEGLADLVHQQVMSGLAGLKRGADIVGAA